ncbi:hypothetical protein RBH29_16055 [Herbivorax sp. ANBcel31]|uniref:hypothetical protein n=1 Tax=Herbivorax sp. ANBcel31 TaxID=3069754 RepID=UPI0027B2D8D5|nr:hypothetical protein [Herbivorax sp. ANBcel31]MDQ2087943.1 hypothetical protein [Herbivorax sp. ANBcel31]
MSLYNDKFKNDGSQLQNVFSKELVCINVTKILDQVALRSCVKRDVVLSPGKEVCDPIFNLDQIKDYYTEEFKVKSVKNSITRPEHKKLNLYIKITYTIYYSDGFNHLVQQDSSDFNLVVEDIYCPNHISSKQSLNDIMEYEIKANAISTAFGEVLCPSTGALMFDIGVFFIIKCQYQTDVLVPTLGYCPIPSEQKNNTTRNCTIFKDKSKTPFPRNFFPKEKQNPLDRNQEDSKED